MVVIVGERAATRFAIACTLCATLVGGGCGGGRLHARAALDARIGVELAVVETGGSQPRPRPERHMFWICDASRVRAERADACPLVGQGAPSAPVVHFDEPSLGRLESPPSRWCVVVDDHFDECRTVPELAIAMGVIRERSLLAARAAEEEARAEAERARRALEEEAAARAEAERRQRARAEIASRLRSCSMVGASVFFEGGAAVQRLWHCPEHRFVVEDGEQVLYESAGMLDGDVVGDLDRVAGIYLVSITGGWRPDVLLELEDDCSRGIALFAWSGAALRRAWSAITSSDESCGSGDDGVDYEGVAAWWPGFLTDWPRPPEHTVVDGRIHWLGEETVWDGSMPRPSPEALERWNAELDARAEAHLAAGRGASAFRFLRDDAPAQLRERVRNACEQEYLRAIERARTVGPGPDNDPPTPMTRARWRLELALEGLRCAPGSPRLAAAHQRALGDIVLLEAEAGHDYSSSLAAVDDPDVRERLSERARQAAERGRRAREAARLRALRARQQEIVPERVLVGTWVEVDSGLVERYHPGGRCGSGWRSPCRYRWLGRPEMRDDGTVRQVMLVQIGRARGVYQVVTSVRTGRDTVVHISESGRTYVYRRVGS